MIKVSNVKCKEFENANIRFVTMNVDGELRYWYTNASVAEPFYAWYDDADKYDGPANDDNAFALYMNGVKIFDLMAMCDYDEYLERFSELIPCYGDILDVFTLFEKKDEAMDSGDEVELHFYHCDKDYNYYDLSNFITEYTDGMYFISDEISDVWLYGKAQNVRLNTTSMDELARILDAEDAHKIRRKGNTVSCIPNPEVKDERDNRDDPRETELEHAWPSHPFEVAAPTWPDEKSDTKEEPYDLSAQDILTVLTASMPTDFSGFNSETSYGEPQHWMELPNGRSLEITHEEDGLAKEDQYYSFRVHCNEDEFDADDFRGTMGVIAEETADNFEFDTLYSKLDWAIRIAKETPVAKKKPEFKVGDEVYITLDCGDKQFCYVTDVLDNCIRVFNTEYRTITVYRDNELDSLVISGHSEMAEKIFS